MQGQGQGKGSAAACCRTSGRRPPWHAANLFAGRVRERWAPPDKSLAFRLRFYPSTAPRRKPGPWRGGLPCARECPLPPKSACSSRRRQGRPLRLRCHLQTACLPRSSQNPSRAATTSVAEQPVSANCGAQQSDLSWAQPHNAVALNENFLPSKAHGAKYSRELLPTNFFSGSKSCSKTGACGRKGRESVPQTYNSADRKRRQS